MSQATEYHWRLSSFEQLSNRELYAILQLRQRIFIVEQQSIYLDLDDKDLPAVHMLASDSDGLCAYQRCLPPGVSYRESSLGRIAVEPRLRGRRLGHELVRRGVEHNRATWPGVDICISAQVHLQQFYATLGFVAEGSEYMEDGIPHRKMRLSASAA